MIFRLWNIWVEPYKNRRFYLFCLLYAGRFSDSGTFGRSLTKIPGPRLLSPGYDFLDNILRNFNSSEMFNILTSG